LSSQLNMKSRQDTKLNVLLHRVVSTQMQIAKSLLLNLSKRTSLLQRPILGLCQ